MSNGQLDTEMDLVKFWNLLGSRVLDLEMPNTTMWDLEIMD